MAEHPLYPFYEGRSSFRPYLYGVTGNSVDLKDHNWTASPEAFLSKELEPSEMLYFREESEVETSTRKKTFHWNLDNSADDLPKSSVVTVTAKDPSDKAQIKATAKINWHWAFEGAGGGSEDDETITKLPGGTIDTYVPDPYGGTPNVVQKPIQDANIGDYEKRSKCPAACGGDG